MPPQMLTSSFGYDLKIRSIFPVSLLSLVVWIRTKAAHCVFDDGSGFIPYEDPGTLHRNFEPWSDDEDIIWDDTKLNLYIGVRTTTYLTCHQFHLRGRYFCEQRGLNGNYLALGSLHNVISRQVRCSLNEPSGPVSDDPIDQYTAWYQIYVILVIRL